MNKARALSHDGSKCNILPGSLADPVILLCPISPTTPFEFPFVLAEATYCDFSVTDALPQPFLKDSVSRVVGLPCVCGLSLEEDMVVRVTRATTASERWDNPLLMDGGANICITGVLDLLVDVVSIAPLPILVATKMGAVSLDDCYTKQGLLPLMLDDGTSTTSLVITARMQLRLSFLHRRFLLPVMSLSVGLRRGIKMDARVRFVLIVIAGSIP